jgi:hypothetical protein
MMKTLFILFVILNSSNVFSQKSDQKVIKTLMKKDSLFWVGYNTCNLDLLAQFLSNDIKLYHDKGGMTSGLSNFKKRMQLNIGGDADYKVSSEPVAGTFKLFLLKNDHTIYGAIISCEHYFYHFEKGRKESKDDDIANFTGLWLFKNGEWKMHEIFSFNHVNIN